MSPNEILNPDLKALEQTYFQQLIGINQSPAKARFPFPLFLSRDVGLDKPSKRKPTQAASRLSAFEGRAILKISGNYNAAYDTLRLTQNGRA